MRQSVLLLHDAFDDAALYRDFVSALDAEGGAVVTFTGRMRAAGSDGTPLDHLVLEHHPERTVESLHDLAAQVAKRHALSALQVVHRAGRVSAGDPIVWVAAAAAHRRAAFLAADELMDRLKTEAVLWKREEGAGVRRWIEPTLADQSDVARWEDAHAGRD